MIDPLEKIRILININYTRLTASHKITAETFYLDVRAKLLTVTSRKGVKLEIPHSLHEERINNQKGIEELQTNTKTKSNMTQTAADNLQSFIDELCLVDSIKETHDAIA